MNRLYYLLFFILLVSCGKPPAVSYHDYQQSHQRSREEHIRLIKSDAALFDTLARQDIELMKENKHSREFIIDSWTRTEEFFGEMRINQQVYSHIIVYNDHTSKAVATMWSAYSDLKMVDDVTTSKVTRSIRNDQNYNQAIDLLQGMRTDVKRAMERMLNGAEEYDEIVFRGK